MGAQSLNELCIMLKENPIVLDRKHSGSGKGGDVGMDDKKAEVVGRECPEYCEFDLFDLQDIENAFEQVELVSY